MSCFFQAVTLLAGHAEISRRFFLGCAAVAAGGTVRLGVAADEPLPAELDLRRVF